MRLGCSLGFTSYPCPFLTTRRVSFLLSLSSQGGRGQAAAQRIEFVVDKLAETYVPPQTLPFMNLLMEATWVNVYNSWTLRREVRSVGNKKGE